MSEPYIGCMRHAWTDDGNVGCPSCASETKPAEPVRPFLMAPAIIDWLQWCDELETPLGKPDYPQLALTLIAEYKAHIAKLEAENARIRADMTERFHRIEDEVGDSERRDVPIIREMCKAAREVLK